MMEDYNKREKDLNVQWEKRVNAIEKTFGGLKNKEIDLQIEL